MKTDSIVLKHGFCNQCGTYGVSRFYADGSHETIIKPCWHKHDLAIDISRTEVLKEIAKERRYNLMTIKPSETNYATPENIITALKQTNKERGETINNFAESNARLRVRIAKLTDIITMMKVDIAEVTQKLKEAAEA